MKMMAATGTKFRNSTYKPGDWVVTNHKPTQTNLTRGKMKTTAESIAKEMYLTKEVTQYLVDEIKAYARQEVEKHLAIAAEEAIIFFPTHHLHGTKNVDKSSITGIKIELT